MVIEKINNERLLHSFLRYAAVNSPSCKEQELANIIEPELIELGFDIVYDRAGEKIRGNCNNMIATLKGSIPGIPIALSVHLDTVVPTDGWDYIIENGRIHTSGNSILGADDKAGIAAVFEAVRVLGENSIPHADIQIILSVSEEPGLRGALNMDTELISSKYVYVFDVGEPVGKIYTAAPRHAEISAVFMGKGSHAGMCPENGVSAIRAAACAIMKMKTGRIDSETTANIGMIQGGNAVNAVPEVCEIRGEARSINDSKIEAQLKHMQDCCYEAARETQTNAKVTINEWYGGYNLDIDSPVLCLAKEAVKMAGLPVLTGITGGGSDANIFNSKGIPSVPIGIGYKNAHSVRESIGVVDLQKTTAVAVGLILTATDRLDS